MYASVDLLALSNTEELREVPEAMGTLGMCLYDAGHRDEGMMVRNAIGKVIEKVERENARRVARAAAEK